MTEKQEVKPFFRISQDGAKEATVSQYSAHIKRLRSTFAAGGYFNKKKN